MGLRIINRVYTDLEGRTGDSMQGNYLDPSIVQYDVEYDAKLCLSNYVSVLKKGNLFTLTTGTWYNLNSSFGSANVEFKLGDKGNATTTTIDFVEGAVLSLVDDGSYDDGVYYLGYFQITDAPELFEVDFNLIQNSLGASRFSVIDSEVQRLSVTLVNALAVTVVTDSFIQLGNKSGGSGISSTIERTADVGGNKRYTILINYKNWVLLDSDMYKADDCIGDYVRIRATSKRGNDNAFVEVDSKNIGDTGYENEALNGGTTDYVLNTLEYADSLGNIMVALDPSQTSFLEANITGTFTANHKYGIRLFRLPQDETEYKNKPLNVERNLSLCMNDVLVLEATSNAVTGELNEDGAAFDIANFTVANNTSDIDLSADITPNAAMITLLAARGETNKDYKVILTIDDTTKAYKDANTTNVLIDKNNAVKNVISLGAWSGLADFDWIGSDGAILATPTPLIESDNRMNVTFTLPKSATDNPWRNLIGRIVAERTDGERFEYEAFNYDVSQLPVMPDETLSIGYTQTRGRQLPTTSEFNDVTFSLYPALDTATDFGVQLNYSFQIGYQDWLEVPAVSDYFYGSKNNNWYNVSSSADWQLKFELALVNEDGTYVDSKDFAVTNYGQWTGTVVKSYEDEDSNIVTRPLANQVNTITAVATGLNPYSGNEFAAISVRDKDGFTLWRIATDIDPVSSGNPLQPIVGETRLKITVLSNVATLECLIDTNLINVKEYTLVVEFNADV